MCVIERLPLFAADSEVLFKCGVKVLVGMLVAPESSPELHQATAELLEEILGGSRTGAVVCVCVCMCVCVCGAGVGRLATVLCAFKGSNRDIAQMRGNWCSLERASCACS